MKKWPRVIRTQGSLVGDEYAVIGAKVAGRIHATYVDLGSIVKRGDKVAALDLREFQIRVQQAEAGLEQACAVLGLKPSDSFDDLDASRTPTVLMEKALLDESHERLRRVQKLSMTKTITAVELAREIAAERVAKARYELALNVVKENTALIRVRRAEMASVRQVLSDAVFLAPFDSIVQQRHVAAGAYVQVGDAVVTVVRIDPLRFHTGVPERKAMDVRIGQEVRIQIEGESEPVISQVTRISPALEVSSRSLVLEADFPNPDSRWRAGLFAQAEIVVDSNDQTLAVPTSAVGEFAGVHKVWIVEDERVREQRVQIGRRNDRFTEILSGLELDTTLVANFSLGRDGQADRIEQLSEPVVLGE